MPDYALPQFQQPDFLKSYVQGATAQSDIAVNNMRPAMAQQQLAQGNMALQTGQLNMDQLRQVMQIKQRAFDQYMQESGGAAPPSTGAPPNSGAQSGAQAGGGGQSGGIQNGPQGAVGATPAAANDPLGPLIDTRRIQANAHYASAMALAEGKDPNAPIAVAQKINEDANKDLIERTKVSLSPQADLVKQMISDPNIDSTILANAANGNPVMLQHYMKYAPLVGADAKKIDALSAKRAAIAYFNAEIAAKSMGSIDPIPMPNPLQKGRGSQGQPMYFDPTGEKAPTLEAGASANSYQLEKSYDPQSGRNVGNLVQTGGGAMGWGGGGGQSRPTGSASGSGSAPAGTGVDLGMAAPSEANIKQVGFADTLLKSMGTIRALEAKGVALTPTQRAQVIRIATDGGDAGWFPGLNQWTQQEALKHNLGPDAQTYLAAMMPVIQAVSHDQSGARLNEGTIKSNLESVMPVDVKNTKAMSQINSTRESWMKTTALGAGSAAYSPGFKNSVGAYLDSLKNQGNATQGEAPASAIEHLKAHPELRDAFKQKYGYLPGG
jgi:hypothetical protein